MYTQTQRFQQQLRAQSTPGVLHVTLPFPPSANGRWEFGGINKVRKNRRISHYEVEVAQACMVQLVGIPRPLQPPYAMSLELTPPEGVVRPDLDNMLKNLMDALVCAGLLVDDRHMEAISLVYGPAMGTGEVQVHVWTLHLEELHGDAAESHPVSG
jgi:Holliday junction resolvase RusA-like endonuclease